MNEVKVLSNCSGELKIALCGDIDAVKANEFYNEVVSAYNQNKGKITFVCDELRFIDSTTLGTFVKILKTVKTDGYTLCLKNLQPNIKKLFTICSLDTIMEIA